MLAALFRRPDVQNELEQEAANWFPDTAHFGTIGDAPPEVVEAGLKKLEEDCRSQNRDDCRRAMADVLALAGRLEVEGS